MKPILYIGNRNYSSWSLRPWLVLRWAGIDFEERMIDLDQPGYAEQRIAAIRAVSPSGRVPALEVDGLGIWDSLAIAEWAAERAPAAQLWPAEPAARAIARAATAEMHSGFSALRTHLPMHLAGRRSEQRWDAATRRDLERVFELWTGLRARHASGGPWLMGARGIVDAFYAPVVTRLRTYSVTVPPEVARYCETSLADADFRAWEHAAQAEPRPERFRRMIDDLYG